MNLLLCPRCQFLLGTKFSQVVLASLLCKFTVVMAQWLSQASCAASDASLPDTLGEGGAGDFVYFAVTWMVGTDQNASGQTQWVDYPQDVVKRLEDAYLDPNKGVDDHVD